MRKEAVVVSWLGWMRVADSCARVVGAMEESCLAFKEGHSLGEERKHQADYLGWAEMGEGTAHEKGSRHEIICVLWENWKLS